MKMEVKHRLAGRGAAVCDDPKSGVIETGIQGDLPRQGKEFTAQRGVLELVERVDVFPRNDEHMDRRGWGNVAKRHGPFALGDEFRAEVAPDDFAEDALVRHFPILDRAIALRASSMTESMTHL
jgi:hypothetical protein